MKLSVYSLQKILFQGDAKSLTCTTEAGVVTILDHHQALISALAPGAMKVIGSDRKEHFFDVTSGFLQVSPSNEVRCIVD